MTTVGVVGLGRMGAPIAARLTAAGLEVTAFDLRMDAAEAARRSGIRIAATGSALASSVDVVATVLPGPDELRAAMVGPDGMLTAMPDGGCWLDLTSCDPSTARTLGTDAAERGIDMVGAPMGGGPADAANGTLTFFAAGAGAAIERVRPLLSVLGGDRGTRLVGEDVAAGYLAKLLVNTLWFGQVVAVTEVLLLGRANGIDPVLLKPIIESSAGGSAFISRHLDALLEGDYLTTFGIDRVVEELDTVTTLARAAGTPARLTHLVADLHAEALALFGPVDGEMLAAKLLEQHGGGSLHQTRAQPSADA